MEDTVSSVVNFVLAALGFLSMLSVVFGPLSAIVLGILYFIEDKPNTKAAFKKWMLISLGVFAGGLLLIGGIFVGYAAVNS